jgi:hypothetical protein
VGKYHPVRPIIASLIFSFSFYGATFFDIEKPVPPPVVVPQPKEEHPIKEPDCYRYECYPIET